MNCQSCGNENRTGAKYCRFCGQAIPVVEPSWPEPNPPDLHTDDTRVPIKRKQSNADDPFSTLIVDPLELFGNPPGLDQQPGNESPIIVEQAREEISTDTSVDELDSSEQTQAPEIISSSTETLLANEPPTNKITGIDEEIASIQSPNEAAIEKNFEGAGAELHLVAMDEGTILLERYRITSLLAEDEETLVYQTEDLRKCWSCGAEQSDSDPRFCEMCGMELTSHPTVIVRQSLTLPLNTPDTYFADGFTFQVEPVADITQIPLPPRVAGYFAGYASDTGRLREIDEDSVLVLQLAGLCNRCSGPTLGFFAVADGIGGQDAGEVASRTAIHALAEFIMQQVYLPAIAHRDNGWLNLDLEGMLQEKLIQAVSTANQAVIDLRQQTLTGSNMGCTLTAALLVDRTCIIANVGDSRTYHLHSSRLTQITRDHSIVADMVADGEISPTQALEHDRKGIIYRCLGDLPDLEIDTFLLELDIGDRLMLCCDGLWEMVPDGLIEDILLQYTDPQATCQRLVSLANEAGGEDNISVILVNIQSVT